MRPSPRPTEDAEVALAPELDALARSIGEEAGRFVFPQPSLRAATEQLARLSPAEKEQRTLQVLALGIKLLRGEPVRAEQAALQLATLAATLAGDPRLARDLFQVVKRSSAEAELTGRAPLPARAPALDAPAPTGTLKLGALAPASTPRPRSAMPRGPAVAPVAAPGGKTDPRVGAKPAIAGASPAATAAGRRASSPLPVRRGR